MRLNAWIVLLFFTFTLGFASTSQAVKPVIVTGKVVSNGSGIAQVPVTDGVNVTLTDKKGNYTLTTTSERSFIYYTLPSGYESPVVDGIPIFYKAIAPGAVRQKINFEIRKADRPQDNHAFIAWADPQVLDMEEVEMLKEVMGDLSRKASSLKERVPVHALTLGDIVFDRFHLYPEYIKVISNAGLPFYHVLGNHDMDYNGRSDERSDSTYSSYFGPSHYSFNVGNIHYVVLKDVFYYGFSYRYMGYVNETQLKWLERDLTHVKPGSTVVVSLHIPTIPNRPAREESGMSGSVMNRNALFKILEPYQVHLLAGHSHTQWNTVASPTLFEHVHAAASGAWWQGEVSTDGSPRGYTVYEVKGNELTWYFQGAGLSKEEQFKLYPAGSDEKYPDCIIANVYNYDPEWEVAWYENGKRMGEMQQYRGIDPLAKEMYQPGKNKKHSWLSASETGHLFKAELKDRNAAVEVVVKDRFGNVYRKQLARAAQAQEAGPWKLVWSDEFSTDGLPDTIRWNYDTRGNTYGWGNNELQWYTVANPRNAAISDGTLKIIARHEETSGKEYSSARLTSKDKGDWKYGKMEVRAKVPTGRGTWPAIWMLPTVNSYGGWPKSGEIDIMEHVGYDPYIVHSTVHTGAYNHSIGTQVGKPFTLPTATTEFHVYTTEWDENEIRSYVDGELYFSFKNEKTGSEAWPFDQPFHIILNLAIGGGWGGQKGVDNSLFPHTFEVDYVRIYQ